MHRTLEHIKDEDFFFPFEALFSFSWLIELAAVNWRNDLSVSLSDYFSKRTSAEMSSSNFPSLWTSFPFLLESAASLD